MKSIRFGFLGAGHISLSSAASINKHPNASIVAAQDINAERLKALCVEQQICKSYETAEALLADPDIDAVYIAVPNRFHVPLTIQALEAGKHVVLEKPFAMSYAEAQQAAEAAQKAGKLLVLGMNQRFSVNPQRVKALVEAGTLGEIYHAKACWMRRSGIPRLGTWFGSKELAGAGCLYDIGVHVLDLALYVIGNFDVVSVTGATYTKFGNRGLGEGGWGRSDRSDIQFDVDDFASGFLRLANGTTVALDVTWACHNEVKDKVDIQLFGTEGGAFAVSGRYLSPSPEGYQMMTDLTGPVKYPHADRFHNFINHLLGTEELCVTLDEALKVQRILDALAESAATGREVRLDS